MASAELAEIARRIAARLREQEASLRVQWVDSKPVRHFHIDDLLAEDEVRYVYEHMPPPAQLMLKQSLRERKRVGLDVDHYDPAIGAYLLAFQQPEVISAVAAITGIEAMEPDPSLYASGISLMTRGDFLNPHLDNSHNGEQDRYRVLNLLFYASPGWSIENGGNLELWTPALDSPTVIESRFNRLVVMETNDESWHSVQPVVSASARVCLSNYYFSRHSSDGRTYRNVTSFRGRPEELVKRPILRIDSMLLNFIGRAAPFLLRRNKHRRK